MAWSDVATKYSRRRGATRFLPLIVALVGFSIALDAAPASAASRIKDNADFEGIRDNYLVGYGLVVGLNGTGDDIDSTVFTRQSLEAMLERLGVATRGGDIDSENVAAVMVSANLPPFARHGTRIDVTVSALGDSESLLGGLLLVTPLMGADGEVYAVAQGSLVVGGFAVGGDAEEVVKSRAFPPRPVFRAARSSSGRSALCSRASTPCASHYVTPTSRPPVVWREHSTPSLAMTWPHRSIRLRCTSAFQTTIPAPSLAC